jgi:serine protease AprX
MSVSDRRPALVAVGALVASLLVTGAPAGAATPDPGPQPPVAAADPPGKGDPDGDGIADDLAAALASAAPGERLSVIVQGASPAAAAAAAPSLRLDHRYRTIRAFSGSLLAGQVRALAKVRGVTRVELNGVARALDASGDLDYGVTAARAAGVASDGTLDGDGVGICVIDTGVDPSHEQLSGKVVGWRDWVNGRPDPYDDHGHGTHVSSIAAGSGQGSAQFGGVARAASIIAAKVLSSSGSGADADVVSAIEWCAARSDVHVISMSLGSPGSDGSDAGSAASDAAVAAGKVVVAAAGNSGDAPGTISSPGVATDVITVGAASDPSSLAGSGDTDTGLYLAGFSSRGPTTNPAAPHKPDVVAPGLSVVAARAGTVDGYVSYSGTSMATPFVAGVIALGLEASPSATPAQLKAALAASAHDAGAPGLDDEWGNGLVDAAAFVSALAGATASAPWPGHLLLEGTVAAASTVDLPVEVTASGAPLGVTLRTANGSATCVLPLGSVCFYGYEWSPDLDIYLLDPTGAQMAASRCMLEATNGNCAAPGRFETIGVPDAAAGTWTLRVESFSGAGDYAVDVFGAVGAQPPPPQPPSAPTGLVATSTSSSTVDLAWNDTSSTETSFTVQRCTGDGCGTFADVATLDAGSTSWTDTGLAADTPYTYRVRAEGDGGPSGWSPTASARTQPAAPVSLTTPVLTATSVSASSVDLGWTGGGDAADGYRVFRCEGNRCSTFALVASLGPTARAVTDPDIRASTKYTYYVEAWSSVAGIARSADLNLRTPRR